jgi:hypothetical protein
VDAVVLPQDETQLESAVIDPTGHFAYFGTSSGSSEKVIKVDLDTFQRAGSIDAPPNFQLLRSAVMDPAGRFAYFGGYIVPQAFVAQTTGSSQNVPVVGVPRYDWIVFGRPDPDGVLKVDLDQFAVERVFPLAHGETNPYTAVIDPAGNYAYFGTVWTPASQSPTDQVPPRVVKVQLRRPPNPALVAGSDAYSASDGTALTVPAPGVLANDHDTDGDPVQAGQASDPHNGSVTLNPDGSLTYTPNPGFAGTDTFTYTVNDGMDYSPPGTVTVQVAAAGVTGRAVGYHAEHISLFGGNQPDTGPTPTLALAPDGSNSPQSASAPTGLVQYGPATLFTSDGIDLSASVSPGGATVSASSAISDVNKATTQPSTGSEVLTADRIEGACSATATAVSGSTTVTNGTLRTKAQDPNFPDEGLVTIPTNPSANYAVDGYLWLSATSQDHWRIVFNEQQTNPDGSITVNPVHEYFQGPTLLGDMVLGQSVCRWAQTAVHSVKAAVADFDGNGTTDASVFRPSTGVWYAQGSPPVGYGIAGDIAVPADYDGDGKADEAVFRPSNGTWYIQLSGGGEQVVAWGIQGDIPVPADYDGAGKAEVAVFRPSNGTWYVHHPDGSSPAVAYGISGDVPVPADYDGDGKADMAVFRPSNGTWYLRETTAGEQVVAYGTPGDVPVPADYDGDGKADVAVFRPSNGTWYLGGSSATAFGTQGDVPVPGDYNGDGRADIAVFRPANGTWYFTGGAATGWGTQGDVPLPLPASIYASIGP